MIWLLPRSRSQRLELSSQMRREISSRLPTKMLWVQGEARGELYPPLNRRQRAQKGNKLWPENTEKRLKLSLENLSRCTFPSRQIPYPQGIKPRAEGVLPQDEGRLL